MTSERHMASLALPWLSAEYESGLAWLGGRRRVSDRRAECTLNVGGDHRLPDDRNGLVEDLEAERRAATCQHSTSLLARYLVETKVGR